MARSTDPDPEDGPRGTAPDGGASHVPAASPFAPDDDGYPQDPYAPLPPGAPEDPHTAAVAAALAQDRARKDPGVPTWADREPSDPRKNRGLMIGAFAAGVGVTMALLVVVGLVIAFATGAMNTTSPTGSTAAASADSGSTVPATLRMPEDVDGWRPQPVDAEVTVYVKGDSPRRVTVATQGTSTALQGWIDGLEGEHTTSADGRVTCATATGDPMCVLQTEAVGVVSLTTLSDGVAVGDLVAIGAAIAAVNP